MGVKEDPKPATMDKVTKIYHTREIAPAQFNLEHVSKGVDELLLRDYSPDLVKCLAKLGDIKLEQVLEDTVYAECNDGRWNN